MTKPKILVTGSTGLLGSSLLSQFKGIGFKLIAHGYKHDAELVFDLTDSAKTHAALSIIKPDVIINLVGLTSVELCQEQPKMAYLVNARTVENIVGWISNSNPSCHLIQISTDQVYDSPVLNKEDAVSLSNIYAYSKYAGEQAANRVNSSILRTNFIGRSKAKNRESLSDWIFYSMLNSRQVEVLSDVYFSPLSMFTLVEMIKLVVDQKPIGIFNLGSHNGMSKADFDYAFAKRLKLPVETMTRIKVSDAKFMRAYRPKDMRMDCSKFENALGVKLPDFEEEIVRVAKDYVDVA